MSTWKALGFKNSPYDSAPLKSTKDDVELLVGRKEEMVQLFTILDTNSYGVIVISGVPGVGKTSFLNVSQYLLESRKADFGPRLLSARRLCPVQPFDTPRDVALRSLQSLVRSVRDFCTMEGINVPKKVQQVSDWLQGIGTQGYDFGLQILGSGGNFARETRAPAVSEVTFEGLQEILEVVAETVVDTLNFDGCIIALDNLENLEDEQLKNLLMTFRDTLFEAKKVWWVLIGQSGLSSLIQSLDPRISERIAGVGLELLPISLAEMNEAVERRVSRFHTDGTGKAPLRPEIHERLFNASHGEMRFVFKYSDSICVQFVARFRLQVQAPNGVSQDELNRAIGRALIEQQISTDRALEVLRSIVERDLNGLNLRDKDKRLLDRIGERGSARAKQASEFGFKTQQDFSANYLTKLYGQHLLVRRQEGTAVLYRLRGVAAMAREFGLLANTELTLNLDLRGVVVDDPYENDAEEADQ